MEAASGVCLAAASTLHRTQCDQRTPQRNRPSVGDTLTDGVVLVSEGRGCRKAAGAQLDKGQAVQALGDGAAAAVGPRPDEEALEDRSSLLELPGVKEQLAVVAGGAPLTWEGPAASSKAIARSNRATWISPVRSLSKNATAPTVSASSDSPPVCSAISSACRARRNASTRSPRSYSTAASCASNSAVNGGRSTTRSSAARNAALADRGLRSCSTRPSASSSSARSRGAGSADSAAPDELRGAVGVSRRIGQIDRRQHPSMPRQGAR